MIIQTSLAGAQFRPSDAKELIKTIVHGDELTLERDPENEYDANAIRVLFDDIFIGFVPRADAANLAPLMDSGTEPVCVCIGSVGTLKPAFEIQIEDEEEIHTGLEDE